MLRLIYVLKDALYFSLLQGLEGVCCNLAGLRTPTDVWVILSEMKDIVHGAAIGWLQMGRKKPVPEWMVQAFAEGQFPCGGDGEEDYKRFGYAMRKGMEAAAAEIRAEIDSKQKEGAA